MKVLSQYLRALYFVHERRLSVEGRNLVQRIPNSIDGFQESCSLLLAPFECCFVHRLKSHQCEKPLRFLVESTNVCIAK
jgi:hypothetical protein